MGIRACWNCLHGGGASHDPAGAMILGVCCHCPVAGFPWHLYRRYGGYPSVMPSLCGHYEPREAGTCPVCGARLGPEYLVDHWAGGVFGTLPCCSPGCRDVQEARFLAEEARILARTGTPDPEPCEGIPCQGIH